MGGGKGEYYKNKYGGGRSRGGGGRGRGRGKGGFGKGGDAPPPPPPGTGGGGSGGDLRRLLERLERASYGAYQDLRSTAWAFGGMTLFVDNVQKDAFAPPTRCRVVVQPGAARLPPEAVADRVARVATGDWLARKFFEAARAAGDDKRTETGGWGGKKGGEVRIAVPSQFVLERTSGATTADGAVELRFTVALPASGRSIEGVWCARVLCDRVPALVEAAVVRRDDRSLAAHVSSVAAQRALRAQLAARGLVAFVGDGCLLARRAGNDDRPMVDAKPFDAAACGALRVTLDFGGRPLPGLGLPKGISLICGGGFHGKSTLLQALQVGCYDKAPGDGREACVCDENAVKVRAEDGRCAHAVDISPFIGDLPLRPAGATKAFSSPDASGSTSQAAAICEAIEVGASTLLFDEDTCATNFMIRDGRMARLVASDKEPIVPFVRRARQLADENGVSSILVLGGTGDYFDVADAVVVMESFAPRDATATAKAIAAEDARNAPRPPAGPFRSGARTPRPCVAAGRTGAKAVGAFSYGDNNEVDMSCVEQLVEVGQTQACCKAIEHAARALMPRGPTTAQLLDALEASVDAHGLDAIQPEGRLDGDLARPRRFEMAAALNRVRTASFVGGAA